MQPDGEGVHVERALRLRDERAELVERTPGLVEEFSWLVAGYVIATMVRCRDELERTGVRDGLAAATLAMTRQRLRETVPATLVS